jgi:hypothetical protein
MSEMRLAAGAAFRRDPGAGLRDNAGPAPSDDVRELLVQAPE